jgi:uncharacterized membrane protein YccF (DUF307 family)
MVWVLILFASFPLWMGVLQSWFGAAGVFTGLAFTFAQGLVLLLVLTCPNCGRSLFKRGNLRAFPWPVKVCSKCGYDLTKANKGA